MSSGFFNAQVRAAAKQQSRQNDDDILAKGLVSQEELGNNNALFSLDMFPGARIGSLERPGLFLKQS